MKMYEKFLKLNIDCSDIGLERNDNFYSYFCTPKGARIIGCAGVDGIHYCFIKGFGEMVFSVSPENLPGDYVHPLAYCFEDFIRLILACGDLAAIEQTHAWTRQQFEDFHCEYPPTPEQTSVLEKLKDGFSLSPMEEPFAYIKELQAAFDYSKIPYTADYYNIELNSSAPLEQTEWKVYYDGGYWMQHKKGRAGKEITLNSRFAWDNEIWHIPAIYSCAKGLVIDYCAEINPVSIKAFTDKWDISRLCEDQLTREQREYIEQENPLNVDSLAVLVLNGKEMHMKHGYSMTWIPENCLPEGAENQSETKRLIEYYGLDATRGWSFHRWSYPWATKRKPEIKSLRLKLERQMTAIPGMHFTNPSVGDVIPFTHPITGTEHKLTVQEYEQQEFSAKTFANEEYEYPTHHTAMVYTLEPELPTKNFQVQDCLENEAPKRKPSKPFEPQATYDVVSVDIIGGADGPTAIMLSNKPEPAIHTALSALHFEPTEEVEWRMVFREKLMDDIEISLI